MAISLESLLESRCTLVGREVTTEGWVVMTGGWVVTMKGSLVTTPWESDSVSDMAPVKRSVVGLASAVLEMSAGSNWKVLMTTINFY